MEEPVTVYSFEVWDQTQGAYVAQRLDGPAARLIRLVVDLEGLTGGTT